jgi:hypothetical protein
MPEYGLQLASGALTTYAWRSSRDKGMRYTHVRGNFIDLDPASNFPTIALFQRSG